MRPYQHIMLLINNNSPLTIITLLIDFYFTIGEITNLEKNELLLLVNVETYNINSVIEDLILNHKNNKYLDKITVKYILEEYVLANILTQVRANEIKTALGF